MTFDETVTYLETNLKKKARYSPDVCYTGNTSFSTVMLNEVTISSDGSIKCEWGKIYEPITFNLNKVLKIENQSGKIRFFITDSSYYYITTDTQVDAERLTKAFNHLKSLLPKEQDPFGE